MKSFPLALLQFFALLASLRDYIYNWPFMSSYRVILVVAFAMSMILLNFRRWVYLKSTLTTLNVTH